MQEKFKNLINRSQRVFVTSHISPDPDAICSILLLGRTLKENFPSKQIFMALEEKPARSLDFLEGYDNISFGNLFEQVNNAKPDLLIIVDAMNCERVSRNQGVELRELLESLGSKTVVIDHHASVGQERPDLYINEGLSATTHQLYRLLFENLSLQRPAGYANQVLLGILTDTQRFKHANPKHRETFMLASDLLDEGASIELLENKLSKYTLGQMKVLSDLARNASDSGKGYSYTYVSDNFAWDNENKSEFSLGCAIFINDFIRNLEGNSWGFVVYPDIESGNHEYSVSFRSVAGRPDVSQVAEKLGGGGHRGAAGAKRIEAKSAPEAVKVVEAAIQDVIGQQSLLK